jgi:hypothetical protein
MRERKSEYRKDRQTDRKERGETKNVQRRLRI